MRSRKAMYLFLDEGGSFDFSHRGTPIFTITSVLTTRPFEISTSLNELRHDFMEAGLDLEEFHASEDRQTVRDAVFSAIETHIGSMRIDSLIVRKCMTAPAQREPEVFYPRMLGNLLKWVIRQENLMSCDRIMVIMDAIDHKRRRRAIEAEVKRAMARLLPELPAHCLLHHDSRSNACLQVADYANWAIYRKWKDGDERSHGRIRAAIRSEFDIFRHETRKWY